MERIAKVLDELNISNYSWHEIGDSGWDGFVEFWTDISGQDIPVEISFDGTAEDFVKKFVYYAETYDVDEEVELFAEMRGQRGVPKTIRELLDDCQEAKDTLMEIAEKLQVAIGTKEEHKTYKLCARITREIEITEDELEQMKNYLFGCVEHCDLSNIRNKFFDGINVGKDSYIPYEWIMSDFEFTDDEINELCRNDDINLDCI